MRSTVQMALLMTAVVAFAAPPQPPADLQPLESSSNLSSQRYARWARGPDRSNDYFPIGVWLQDPRLATKYRDAGINVYVGLWQGPTEQQLDALHAAGMRVICDQNETALQRLDDLTIMAWMHGDEPDNAHRFDSYWRGDKEKIHEAWPEIYEAQRLDEKDYTGYGPPVPPKWIVRDYEQIQRRDPSRPIFLNLGQGVAWDAYHGRGERTGKLDDYSQYLRGCDIASFDIYPAVHRDQRVSNALWYVARGVRRLREWSDDQRIVWNVVECTRISNPSAQPTPAQVRAEVWMSIIHGSRGIVYFVHQFKPSFNEHALLDDPTMLAAVTALNQQIHGLAPVINSRQRVEGIVVETTKPTTPVHIMARHGDNATYVFAVAMHDDPTEARIGWPDLPANATVEVLGESRQLTTEDGSFSDSFQG
jgi:hypothetical protein